MSESACPLTVTHRDTGAVWVVHLNGEADLTTQTTLAGALSLALSTKRDTVIVDLSGLTFCDSTCVLTVLDANREGRLMLTGHTGMVSRVFQILDPGHAVSRHE